MSTLSVARQFSKFPGGRFRRISEYSGEEFRDAFLLPALERESKVVVDLDGVVGYGSSFLEEVFGGLVRAKNWMTRSDFDQHVLVKTSRPSWLQEVNQYVDEEIERRRTKAH